MARLNATEFQEKWSKNLKASTQEIIKGVDRVTEAPSQLAIAQQEKMLAKLVEAIQDGRWAAGLEKVSLQDWKDAMKNKGVQRVSAGVDGASQKMRDFGAWLIPRVEEGQAKLSNMPSITLEDNIQRMVTFVRHMSEQKFKR